MVDRVDIPGHEVRESAGSRRGQEFVAAGGSNLANEGEAVVALIADNDTAEGQEIQSTFQVAAVTRPLWSVSEIMDNMEEDSEAVFRRHEGLIRDGHGRTISKFRRKGGLYVGLLRMRNPKFQGFRRQA